MSKSAWEVVIIGAGAAGLAAASELVNAGRSILILEARDRIGGRIWTRHEPDSPVPLELGAEFIHGAAPDLFGLLRRAGGAAIDAGGAHWTVRHGKFEQHTEDLFAQIQKALEKSGVLEGKDVSFETFLNSAARHGLSPAGIALARAFVEGFDAADPARVSTRSIAEEWRSGGLIDAPQFRPPGGYGSVLSALAASLQRASVTLKLQAIADTVRWKRGAVEVVGRSLDGEFRATASKAIITVPVGVLQLAADAPGALRFTPPLHEKKAALEGVASGPVLKVLLRFRSAFWEEIDGGSYRDVSFFHSPDTTFPTFWTAVPLRAPVLNAWIGGPKAERLSAAADSEIIRQALDSLRQMFGDGVGDTFQLEAAYLHNWPRDPFSLGAYSYVTVGNGDARKVLAAPLQETLFFAGEATDCEGEAATVTGALRSGLRAAREVNDSLD